MDGPRLHRVKTGGARAQSPSFASREEPGAPSRGVWGVMESDRSTVRGALFSSTNPWFWGIPAHRRCVFRTSSERSIAVIDRARCKWCKPSRGEVPRFDQDEFERIRTRSYLRGTFGLSPAEAGRLSELLAELALSAEGKGACPFAGTPPYCTVENVVHISGPALERLMEFDDEFVWGDNLIFHAGARPRSCHT
uniref:Myopalladin-like, partial sequene n=1 Tax=Oryzias latipes TaxID=8090 RepID=A0A286P9U6_ORYLA